MPRTRATATAATIRTFFTIVTARSPRAGAWRSTNKKGDAWETRRPWCARWSFTHPLRRVVHGGQQGSTGAGEQRGKNSSLLPRSSAALYDLDELFLFFLAQDHLLIEPAHHQLFFVRGLRAFGLLPDAGRGSRVDLQIVLEAVELQRLAVGIDRVPPVLLVPLRHRRVGVHLFDDVAPAYAGVVSAEGDLPFLSSVGDDAHLRAAEIVVEQILKPHPGNEQEVPRILSPLHPLAVVLRRQGVTLVEFLQNIQPREAV